MRKKGENNIKPPQGKSCDPLDEIMMSPLGLEVNTPAHALATAHECACASLASRSDARARGRAQAKVKTGRLWGGGSRIFPEGYYPVKPGVGYEVEPSESAPLPFAVPFLQYGCREILAARRDRKDRNTNLSGNSHYLI